MGRGLLRSGASDYDHLLLVSTCMSFRTQSQNKKVSPSHPFSDY